MSTSPLQDFKEAFSHYVMQLERALTSAVYILQVHTHTKTFTNCNKFILPQGRSEDGGLTKETQSVTKEGDDTKVEIKTVSEIPHCWWVSRNSRQQMVLQNMLLYYHGMVHESPPLKLIH